MGKDMIRGGKEKERVVWRTVRGAVRGERWMSRGRCRVSGKRGQYEFGKINQKMEGEKKAYVR